MLQHAGRRQNVRGGDDNLCIHELLVEFGVLTLLIGRGYQSMALLFQPFTDTKLVFGRAEEAWLISGMLAALEARSVPRRR